MLFCEGRRRLSTLAVGCTSAANPQPGPAHAAATRCRDKDGVRTNLRVYRNCLGFGRANFDRRFGPKRFDGNVLTESF